MWGAAVKPGDRPIISAVIIKPDRIRFEINGGPVRKKKWYQHIEISGTAEPVPTGGPPDPDNSHGSFVDLVFDRYVPELTGSNSRSCYIRHWTSTRSPLWMPISRLCRPKSKMRSNSIAFLVGMNRDMVISAKGRGPEENSRKRRRDGIRRVDLRRAPGGSGLCALRGR